MNPTGQNLSAALLPARALQAMYEAVAQVIAEHKREGLPLAVWRDDRVVWIPAEDAEAEFEAARADSSSRSG